MAYLVLSAARPAIKECCGRSLRSATKLFRQFHCFAPPEVIIEPCNRILPKVLVNLGELRGLIYRSDKWNRGRPQTYIHFMDTPPRLTCDPEGKQLYIVGGNYRVTRRGIDG